MAQSLLMASCRTQSLGHQSCKGSGKSRFQLGCPFHLLKEGGNKMKVERILNGDKGRL